MTFSAIAGRYVAFDNSQAHLPDDPATLQAAIEKLVESGGATGIITSNITVGVPGDYSSVAAAMADPLLSLIVPGRRVAIMLQAGYVWSENLVVENGNFGHFIIQSQAAEVAVSGGFSGDVIRGKNATMPTLDCLINAANQVSGNGYLVEACQFFIGPSKGIRNVFSQGLRMDGGQGYARGGNFSGAARDGIGTGILAWAGHLDAQGATVADSGHYGAQAGAAGTLNFRAGIATNCGRHAIRATNGSVVNARDSVADGSLRGFYAIDGGVLNARNSSAINCGEMGAVAALGSQLNAPDCTLDGGDYGAVSQNGSVMDITSSVCTGGLGDIRVTAGGIISASGSTGATNITINTLTASGIIFK